MKVQSISLLILVCCSLSSAATIRKEIHVNVPCAPVWDAVRDFDNVDKRLAPGFVTKVEAKDGVREVTFASGTRVSEVLVSIDETLRRLDYAIAGGHFITYNASIQVFREGKHRCLLVWIVDLLPNSDESYINIQMDTAAVIIKNTLESSIRK